MTKGKGWWSSWYRILCLIWNTWFDNLRWRHRFFKKRERTPFLLSGRGYKKCSSVEDCFSRRCLKSWAAIWAAWAAIWAASSTLWAILFQALPFNFEAITSGQKRWPVVETKIPMMRIYEKRQLWTEIMNWEIVCIGIRMMILQFQLIKIFSLFPIIFFW